MLNVILIDLKVVKNEKYGFDMRVKNLNYDIKKSFDLKKKY